MGVVWLARDHELDLDVAMKFLPDLMVHDEEAVADLKRETRKCMALTHTNIVRIFDFLRQEDQAAVCMEFVDGNTLQSLKLKQPNGCFDASEISPWLGKLVSALQYAHEECRIVHRDLKPSNIMLDVKGTFKVMDFGIARSLTDTHSRLSRIKQSSSDGTLVYMSPQQLMGSPAAVSDDVYSLGSMLYELLAGKPPFYSGDVSRQIETITPTSIRQRRLDLGVTGMPEVPEIWEKTIAACLEKEVKKRPQSVAEIAQRLCGLPLAPIAAASSKVPIPIRDAPKGKTQSQLVPPKTATVVKPTIVKPKRNWKPKPRVVVTALAVVLVATVSWWWMKVESPRRAEHARLEELRQESELKKITDDARRSKEAAETQVRQRIEQEKAAAEALRNRPIEVPPAFLRPLKHDISSVHFTQPDKGLIIASRAFPTRNPFHT
jgi:serine/threonine protein kinase